MITIESVWRPDEKIFLTQLGGLIDVETLRRWKALLRQTFQKIGPNERFKFISDLCGYQPASQEVHREMREVVPVVLASYGFRSVLLDIYEGIEVKLGNIRGINCYAAAHVHHDREKMDEFDERFGLPAERFFSDLDTAREWARMVG
jgi:hypothetical protein